MSCFNAYQYVNADLSTAQEVKLGGYYSPELLPDYLPHKFHLEHDKLVQHNIVDTNGELIQCWNNSIQLHEGTLLLLLVMLHTWNIPGTGREGYKNFKQVCTIIFYCARTNANTKKVLHFEHALCSSFEGFVDP